jgi:hypothetical protein
MAEILERDEVELVADSLLSQYIDANAEKTSTIKFEFRNLNNRYIVFYQKNKEGYWRMVDYDRDELT